MALFTLAGAPIYWQKKIEIETIKDCDSVEVAYFKNQCDAIASSISKKTYPASYPGMAWPADAMVCIASLTMHDKLFVPKYQFVISHWIGEVSDRLDNNGLIPHQVDPNTGKSVQQARGSSQGLMLALLFDIDKKFVREQFEIYKGKFLDSRLGLIGIREYSTDQYGLEDVDSGPVVLQMGSSATIVGLATLERFGEEKSADMLYREIEAFGFAQKDKNHKKYLLGRLPMADAFIVWSHSFKRTATIERPSFFKFHLYSLLLSTILMAILWFVQKPSGHKIN